MNVFDAHSDVLYKMWKLKNKKLFFENKSPLHSSYQRLREGGIKLQTMAIFVPSEVPKHQKTYVALEMLDLFYTYILELSKKEQINIHVITNRAEIKLLQAEKKVGSKDSNQAILYVLLSIEGADVLQGDLIYLRTFHRLGVRSLGLTWNFRNEVADGVGEQHPAGLSNFGQQLIKEMNKLHMAIDVSHLAEKGFWQCLELSKQPIIASHSNVRALCEHPRNLYDEQITAIYKMDGFIGLNFAPFFLTNESRGTRKHLLQHIEYMLSLGGEDNIGIGSDFDGIEETAIGLEHSGKISSLIECCLKYYSESVLKKIFWQNGLSYYERLWRS